MVAAGDCVGDEGAWMNCYKCDHDEREHEGEYYRSCAAEDCECSDLELNFDHLGRPVNKETVND